MRHHLDEARALHHGREPAAHGFDFGKFGHYGRLPSLCLRSVAVFGEGDAIVEGIDHRQFQHAPLLLLQAGPIVLVFLADQLAVQFLDTGHVDISP